MKLVEVFEHLSNGELAQLDVGNFPYGEIKEKNFEYLISSVNLGLTALHKRFNLKEGRVSFDLSPFGEVYDLQRDDILKIEQVFTKEGYELGVNDASFDYGCFTPSIGTIRVPRIIINKGPDLPSHLITDGLEVVYRADHAKISKGADPDKQDVVLPRSHLQALLYFVASRVHNPIGMVNEFNAGNNYAAKFEMECASLENKNIQVDQGQTSTRLTRNGWV